MTRVNGHRIVTAAGAAVLTAGLVLCTWWLLSRTNGGDGAAVANVLALPVSVVGALLTAYGLRAGRPDAVTDRGLVAFQDRIATTEARALQQLLGDDGDPRPADVRFVRGAAATLRWRADNGAEAGSLDTIAAYYRGLGRGRLVVLGEPGAGKTVLVSWMALDLATAGWKAPRPGRPLPLRLNLASFPLDLTSLPAEGPVRAATVRDRLDSWIADGLAATCQIGAKTARALVTGGHVLPLLDGLDGMDGDGSAPDQARAVLAALNLPAGVGRWAVVITCRETRYRELAAADSVLQDATVVTMQELDAEQIIRLLAHRFPDPSAPDQLDPRWKPVAASLRRHPGGRLAICLSRPLRLYLAVAVYRDPQRSPREMIRMDAQALDDHLFRELVPAVVRAHPRYSPARVRRWLATVALYARSYWISETTISLDRIWEHVINPRRLVHPVLAVAVTAPLWTLWPAFHWFAVPGIVLATLITLHSLNGRAGVVTEQVVAFGMTYGSVVWMPGLYTIDMYGPYNGPGDPGGTVLFVSWLVGIAARLSYELARRGARVVGALVFRRRVPMPSSALRRALVEDPLRGVVAGASTWSLALVIFSIIDRTTSWQTAWPEAGSVLAPAIGLSAGLAAATVDSPWPRYLAALQALRRHDQLPARPGRFLDWAYRAGLIRMAGDTAVFRHSDLREHIVTPAGARHTDKPAT